MTLLTSGEASELVHCSRSSLAHLIRCGKVRSIQPPDDGLRLVDVDSLVDYYFPSHDAQLPVTRKRDHLQAEIAAREALTQRLLLQIAVLEAEIDMRQQLLRLTRK